MSTPALPYAGTSGHSGTDTSRERAVRADTSGKTNERQKWVLARLGMVGRSGITVREVEEGTGWHHGIASSVLTNLHIEGRLARLVERRNRCHVYVLPDYVGARDLSPYTPNRRNRPIVVSPLLAITHDEVCKIVTDSIYDARNAGRTVTDAANAAADQIIERLSRG